MGWGASNELGEEQSVQRTQKGESGGLLERGRRGSKANCIYLTILLGTKLAQYLV